MRLCIIISHVNGEEKIQLKRPLFAFSSYTKSHVRVRRNDLNKIKDRFNVQNVIDVSWYRLTISRAPPLSIEMYLATSGTFSIAGYEVCQVSPRRIESTLFCIPTKAEGRIGLNQLKTHRELEQGLVPEWRVKYFDYKVGWLAKRTRQCFDR